MNEKNTKRNPSTKLGVYGERSRTIKTQKSKNIIITSVLITLLGIFAVGYFFYQSRQSEFEEIANETEKQSPVAQQLEKDTEVIAENLNIPWEVVFLPDRSLLFTERPGRVRMIDIDGNLLPSPIATISQVKHVGEGGLLGIVIHPDFEKNQYVYLYYTYSTAQDNTLNRVVRYKFENHKLTTERIIVDAIPGAVNHNGGRIKFGQDNFLYITTGDAQNPSLAQDINSLAGKILRVTDEGKPAPGNPFGNLVYSYGHRNPQGLSWGKDNRLWETEHGSAAYDEVNVIYPGQNYGWPEIRGDEGKKGMEKPFLHSGTSTWAPSGAVIKDDVLYFAGLRGEALFALDIKPDPRLIVGRERMFKDYFKNKFGRIRDVVLGPDGFLYLITSNTDGRGTAKVSDDKLIKINPQILREGGNK